MLKKIILLFLFFIPFSCKPHKPYSVFEEREILEEKSPKVTEFESLIPFLEKVEKLIIDEKIKNENLKEKLKKKFRNKIYSQEKFRGLLIEIYKERDFSIIFSNEKEISPNFEIMMNAILTLPEHALSQEKYPLMELRSFVENYSSTKEKYLIAREKLIEHPLRKILEEFLHQNQIPSVQKIYDTLFMGHKPTGLEEKEIENFIEMKKSERKLFSELNEIMQKLDLLLLKSFFLYALDFKYLIIAHPFKAIKTEDKEKADIKFHKNLYEDFIFSLKDFKETIDSFIPHHPYYKATMEGLKFYKKLAEEKEIKKINITGTLKRNNKGESVKKLKERLYLEGYFNGEINSFFDEELENAVKEYEKTHQFNPDGIVDSVLLRSINKSMEDRVKLIELSLQRWRESDIKYNEPFYVRINIPEFAFELWEREKLIMKHKVVVGNDNWDFDPEERIAGRINRTKIFYAKISEVILNPLWHVPSRIKALELDAELFKEPDFYEKHKYKVTLNPDGTETVYQEETPENALGRIKFLFPNKYGIFMHDTPLKEFFQREIRTFSHGCIRLENPLEVGYYILKKINGMEKEEVDKILAMEEETSIKLNEKIPIYVEYNTVSVEEHGRMMFFADVYKYDRDFFEGKIPYSPEMLKLLQRKIPKID